MKDKKKLTEEELLNILNEQIAIQEGQLEEEISRGNDAEPDCIESDRFYLCFYGQLKEIVKEKFGPNCVKCPRCKLVFGPWWSYQDGEK